MDEGNSSGGKEAAEADIDNDNTMSEELSRYSSPSHSQSSSCTSITNPFYDGPPNTGSNVTENTATDRPSSSRPSRRTSNTSSKRNPTEDQRETTGSRNGQELSGQGRRGMASNRPAEDKVQQKVIIMWDFGYLITCHGFLQFVQLVMTTATLVCLVSAGHKDGGLLNLPLSWHFRIMIFVLVLTLLVTLALLFGNITSLITIFGFEWTFFDMIVYALFAFLFLVGSSLVASAFDFYEKMKTNVSKDTINQLVTCVILGYICMLLNGLIAFISYRKWKVQYRLYQRRKLIEEDEIDL